MKREHLLTAGKLALAAALLVSASSATAAIKNTKHNLGTTAGGTGPNSYSGTAEICVFCHTPHGAASGAAVPLWNRSLAAPASYTSYATLNTTSLDGDTAPVGSVSIACLSCHDGTQAMDTVLNQPGSGATGVTTYEAGVWTGNDRPQGIANLGQDLSNDHPVGIQYGGGGVSTAALTGPTNDTDFVAPLNEEVNTKRVWWVDTGGAGRQKTDLLLYTRTDLVSDATAQPFVECASCHDPHTETATFLRVANSGSGLCLACHTK